MTASEAPLAGVRVDRRVMPHGKYGCILADPPWALAMAGQRKRKKEGAKPEALPYPTMTIEEICAMPVADFANDAEHAAAFLELAVVGFQEGKHDYHFRVELPEPKCLLSCGRIGGRACGGVRFAGFWPGDRCFSGQQWLRSWLFAQPCAPRGAARQSRAAPLSFHVR